MIDEQTERLIAERFDLAALHEHQFCCIDAATHGMDVLAVHPTGSGKSVAFWGAACVMGGITVVVGPLLALAKDQVRRCREHRLPVEEWNSTVKDRDKDRIVDRIYEGGDWILYTTPESLANERLWRPLQNRVTMAVIDEADCVLADRSYRPHYARLGKYIDRINPTCRYACTATLANGDRDTLIAELGLNMPFVTVAPVARGNITIHKTHRSTGALFDILQQHRGERGIIYAATVRTADALFAELSGSGYPVVAYNGRMTAKKRKESQAAFTSGGKPIAIATDAFGRGVDVPDIRYTVAYDPTASIEGWVQQFGRAGRDELPAFAYVASIDNDDGVRSRQFLIESSFPSIEQIKAVWVYLRESPAGWRDGARANIGVQLFGEQGKWLGPSCLSVLQRFGLAKKEPHPEQARQFRYRAIGNIQGVDWSEYEHEKADALDRFEELLSVISDSEDEMPSRIDDYFGVTKQGLVPF